MRYLVLFGLLALSGCRCETKTEPSKDATPPQPTPSTIVQPPPSAEPVWAIVGSLQDLKPRWESSSKKAWVTFESRESAKGKWGIPYPWRMTVHDPKWDTDWDCGIYEQVNDDWRVGYCKGGKIKDDIRDAFRVVIKILPVEPRQLLVTIGNDVTLTLE